MREAAYLLDELSEHAEDHRERFEALREQACSEPLDLPVLSDAVAELTEARGGLLRALNQLAQSSAIERPADRRALWALRKAGFALATPAVELGACAIRLNHGKPATVGLYTHAIGYCERTDQLEAALTELVEQVAR